MKRYTNNDINWPLLTKYFAGETTESENQMVRDWLSEDREHEHIFEQVKKDIEKINMMKDIRSVNVDGAWDKLKHRITAGSGTQELQPEIIRNIPVYRKIFVPAMKWAAVILLLIGFSFGAIKIVTTPGWPYTKKVQTASTSGSQKEIILEDGTSVYLNNGSELIYPRQFKGKTREVRLKGEAYFDVKRDTRHPFVIIAENAEVKVLGTAFNVKARIPEKTIEVYVERGSVQLSQRTNQNNNVVINPGYIGMLSNNDQVKKVKNDDVNYMAWKTHKLVFKETPLSEVVNTLNRVYNVNISINGNNIADLKYNGTIESISLQSVLEALQTAFNLKIENQGKNIIIQKNS